MCISSTPQVMCRHAQASSQVTEAEALRASAEKAAALPKDFDWRRANGTDDANPDGVLEPVMDQADCGSCYAVRRALELQGSAEHSAQAIVDAVPEVLRTCSAFLFLSTRGHNHC